jgi:hypothetical protein|tara:strand:+ start:264 stop:644 length:381 start_codon:yes stop_codon:yes gene_type:complete
LKEKGLSLTDIQAKLHSGAYVYWNGDIRIVDEPSNEGYMWLRGRPENPNRAMAPIADLEPVPMDYELLLRDVRDLSDTELSSALDFLENAKLNTSDRPQATKKRAVKIKEDIKLSSKATLDLLNSL